MIADFSAERRPAPWQARSEAEIALRVGGAWKRCQSRTQERNRLGVACDAVHDAIQQRVKTIAEHIDRHPDLQQKAGVTQQHSRHRRSHRAIMWAFYADTDRFPNSRQAAALAGLDPPIRIG